MTYKQLETAKEVRKWITQIIVPTAMVVATVASVPEVRKGVAEKYEKCKEKVKKKLKKN